MPTWDNIHADNLEDFIIQVNQRLAWILSKLDSKNVKRLDTNETVVKSANGETQIAGPLLLMYDKQVIPVLRLKMGYDTLTNKFIFQMFDALGNLTLSENDAGEAVFAGNITTSKDANIGENLYLGNSAAGIHKGIFFYKDGTVGSITIEGGTLGIDVVSKSNITLEPAVGSKVDVKQGFNVSGDSTFGGTVKILAQDVATQFWVLAKGYITGSGISGTFKSGDTPQKTITVSNGLITSIV